MERQSTKCEEMFVNHVFDKGLISNICKKLIQLSSKKKKKGPKNRPFAAVRQFISPGRKMASVAVDPHHPSVVTWVVTLPLVSSMYDPMSSAHVSTKDQCPYLKSVCEMAKKGVKTITSVAMSSALPVIRKLELQIAVLPVSMPVRS